MPLQSTHGGGAVKCAMQVFTFYLDAEYLFLSINSVD